MRTIKLLLLAILLMAVANTTQAQFLKKIGEAVQQSAENAATRKAEQKAEEAVNAGVDKVTNPETYKGKQNRDNTNTTSVAGAGQQGNAPQTSQNGVTQKLESYTQYDFVPGDRILFFEDFSQDAVGDFPALWTTDGSGEVRTVNVAAGKWLHVTAPGSTYCLNKKIDIPENFILEYDVIHDGDVTNGKEINITLYPDDGSMLREVERRRMVHVGR